jgi:hypothetical protein
MCVIVGKEGRACTMTEQDFELPVTLRQIVKQDRDYFRQIAPETDWREARIKHWRSVEVFGIEGSPEKEEGIENRIMR